MLVDDKSNFMWLVLLQVKSEAKEAIKHIQVTSAAHGPGPRIILRGFDKYCDELDMQRHLRAPYSLQQNGVVERQNQTIVGMTRSLLMTTGMPRRF